MNIPSVADIGIDELKSVRLRLTPPYDNQRIILNHTKGPVMNGRTVFIALLFLGLGLIMTGHFSHRQQAETADIRVDQVVVP